MLDTFIIEQIKRERERSESPFIPLRIELPLPPPPPVREQRDWDERPEDKDRGVVIIDFM